MERNMQINTYLYEEMMYYLKTLFEKIIKSIYITTKFILRGSK